MADNSREVDKNSLTRRGLLSTAVAAASLAPMISHAQTPVAAATPAINPPYVPQGGRGPIKVLFLSKYHEFDRAGMFKMLDSMGQDITWTHIEHPAAVEFYDPKLAEPYDVLLFYDCYAGRVATPPTVPGGRPSFVDTVPSKQTQANLAKLLRNGDKGFVFLHHAISSWAHSWPAGVNGFNAYSEVVGGAADWTTPLKNVRGVDYPRSGYAEDVPIKVVVVDAKHPVTKGVDLSFDIIDEKYLCPMFEDSVHCLTRSVETPRAEDFRPAQAGHPVGSTMTSWVKTAERSPVVYIQHGHSNHAFANGNFQKLVNNAIKWTASPEAKTWAHANAKKIFAS